MTGRVVVLTSGVGGAKLVLRLMHAVPPESVIAIVNTGDDFTHLGLRICPDIDTLLYTLSGRAHRIQGWGRRDESWSFMAALRSLGGEDWFQLGDGDLALHVLHTTGLANGRSLSTVTAAFARCWGIAATILPMTDDPVGTQLETTEGSLPFQQYFVARRCEPIVRNIHFAGADKSTPSPGVVEAIGHPDVRTILIAPSKPFLSVDPILGVPGIRAALAAAAAPVVAVSPLVGGQAVKGPAAKLLVELGLAVSARAIAEHYVGVIDGLLVDERDPPDELGIAARRTDTLMTTLEDRVRVAAAALAFADALRR